jgi:reductive dehalogenase
VAKKGALTTKIVGAQEQIREKDHAHARAARGALGDAIMDRYHAVTFESPIFSMCFPVDRPRNSLTRTLIDYVDGPVNPKKKEFENPKQASEAIKEIAKMFGADLVGICKLEKPYIYSHQGAFFHWVKGTMDKPIKLEHEYAISIGIAMNLERIKASPSFISGEEVALGYINNAVTSTLLAQYIREIGYPARAHHVLNEQVIQPPLAVMAGLGELARCGFLATRAYGTHLRLSTVTTDLPLQIDEPVDYGIQRICEVCRKCAVNCPSQSLPKGEKEIVRGVEKWKMDDEKCVKFWQSDPSRLRCCEACMAVCPMNKPDVWWHKLGWFLVDKGNLARRILIWMDDVVWGKRPKPRVKWLDYEFDGRKLVKGMGREDAVVPESPFRKIRTIK